MGTFPFPAEGGSYGIDGQDVFWVRGYLSEAGHYNLAGSDVSLKVEWDADGGSYVITGQTTGGVFRLNAAPGIYTILGIPIADASGPTGDFNFLVEVQAHDGDALRTFYFSVRGFTSLPTDEPPNQFYEPRVIDPGDFTQTLFSGMDTRGRSSVAVGNVVLASAPPAGGGAPLDPLLTMGFGGRQLTIKALPAGAKSLLQASTLFHGRAKKITSTRPLEKFELLIADRLSDLEQPLLTNRYAGTTTSPGDTAEGDADQKGKIKQRAWGEVRNVRLQQSNRFARIWDATDPGDQDVISIAVYDGAKALNYAGDFPDLASLRAATVGDFGSGADIESGEYATCLALGKIRVRGAPEFDLTADIVVGATEADRTAAQIARQMLKDFGIDDAEIVIGSFEGLDGKNDAVCGFLVDDDRTALASIQEVLDSVGGWLVTTRDAAFQVGRFEEPVGLPALTYNIKSQALGKTLQRIDGPAPVWQVILEYGRCCFTQDGALSGGATEERRAFVRDEFRTVTAEDPSVKDKHLDARSLRIRTHIVGEAAAELEAERQLDLHKIERERYGLAIPLADGWPADIGLAMILEHADRLGMESGRAFNILYRRNRYRNKTIELEGWGAVQ